MTRFIKDKKYGKDTEMLKLNMSQISAILALTLLIFLAGCTPKTETNSIAKSEESSEAGSIAKAAVGEDPVNDSQKVLNSYLTYLNHDSWQEEAYNTNQQVSLSDGALKSYLEKLKEEADSTSSILNGFLNKCTAISSQDVCYEMDKSIKKALRNSVSIEVKDKNPIEVTAGKVIWQVSRKVEFQGQSDFQTVKYVLEKISSNWKITDFIDASDVSISSNLKKTIESIDTRISTDKKTKLSMLETAKKAKDDKCFMLQFNDKLTVTELENEQTACYTSKYINYAEQTKDVSVCDDIATLWAYGMCYGQVAFVTNVEVCDNMINEEYEARGYNKPLSSRDVCYSIVGATRKSACKKIVNEQFMQDCLAVH